MTTSNLCCILGSFRAEPHRLNRRISAYQSPVNLFPNSEYNKLGVFRTCMISRFGERNSPAPIKMGTLLVLPALIVYIACVMSMQYTIRSVPEAVDRAVRDRARREARSINAIVVEALARGLELDAKPAEHTDLDHLIGTWQEDPAFDLAIADFERVDEDAWK